MISAPKSHDTVIREHLMHCSLDEVFTKYNDLDQSGTNHSAIRWLCRNDLFYLMSNVLTFKMHLQQCDRKTVEWVYKMCRMVQLSPDANIDLWARDHYKTAIITVALTIQNILQDPEITFIIFSNTQAISQAPLSTIKRELEINEELKKLFPDILYADPQNESDHWTQSQINVKRQSARKECTVEAMGLLSGTKIGRHADVLVYDDMVVPESVGTAEQIEKTTAAYFLSLSLGTASAKKRLIGTRYHFNDTYSQLLAKNTYTARIHPATDNGKSDGTPVRFTDEQWSDVLERDVYTIACQYLLNPQSGSTPIFNTEDLRYWEVRPQQLSVFILGDPARSLNQSACDTALVVLGLTKTGHTFLLDGMCHRMSLSEKWDNLSLLYNRWHKAFGVKKITVGWESIGNDDVEFFKSEMKRGLPDGKTQFLIHEIERSITGSDAKPQRIMRLEPDIRHHRVWLPWNTMWDTQHPGVPTKIQKDLIAKGHEHLVSKGIRVRHETGDYDLVLTLVEQMSQYPFGKKVDLLDALSRIYDMGTLRKPQDLRDKYGAVWTPAGAKRGTRYISTFRPFSNTSKKHTLTQRNTR